MVISEGPRRAACTVFSLSPWSPVGDDRLLPAISNGGLRKSRARGAPDPCDTGNSAARRTRPRRFVSVASSRMDSGVTTRPSPRAKGASALSTAGSSGDRREEMPRDEGDRQDFPQGNRSPRRLEGLQAQARAATPGCILTRYPILTSDRLQAT